MVFKITGDSQLVNAETPQLIDLINSIRVKDIIMKKTINFLSSLEFTVYNLIALFILVVVGTLAQVELGIYYATKTYFSSLFVYLPTSWGNIPVFPGGFLIGVF